MKKLFLIVLAIILLNIFPNVILAEIKKGDWIISGATDLGVNNSDMKYSERNTKTNIKNKDTEFKISAKNLVSKNIAIGFGVNYNKTSQEVDNDSSSETSNLYALIGSFYLIPEDKLCPFISVEIGNMQIKSTDYSANATAFGGEIGFLYFLTDNIALNFNYGYLTADLDFTFKDTTPNASGDMTQQGFNAGFSIKF